VIWAVLISTIWITIALFVEHDIGAITGGKGDGSLTFWGGIDLVVALPISWFPLVADYSRFARNGRVAFIGTAAGYFVPQVWFYALGVLLVLAAGVTGDLSAPINPVLTAISGLTIGALALFVLLIDETDEGFANIYSTAVSIQNLLPRLSQRVLICIIGAVVLVVAWTVPLVRYESFLLFIGAIFVPLLAVTAADYFVLRGRRYEVEELYRPGGAYWYTGGVNWAGIAAWAAGAATFMIIVGIHFHIFGWRVDVDGQAPEWGGTLPGFIVAFVLHWVLGRLFVRRPAAQTARA
jgi:NCS1 family nucleobase:cation symporter-1